LAAFRAGTKPARRPLGKNRAKNTSGTRTKAAAALCSIGWLLLRNSDINAGFNNQAGRYGPGGTLG
jgi:hypothetical protein